MNLELREDEIVIECIPRVSGDEPITVGTNVARILYSPRERG